MPQFIRFGLIGLLATLLHLGSGLALISVDFNPYIANLLAYCLALIVSFAGHYYLSFQAHKSKNHAFWYQLFGRFMTQSLLCFLINQSLLLVLISLSPKTTELNFVISTSLIVGISYLLNKFWVFKSPVIDTQANSEYIAIRDIPTLRTFIINAMI